MGTHSRLSPCRYGLTILVCLSSLLSSPPLSSSLLLLLHYWTALYILYTSIYRCDVRMYVAINISIRYSSEWVTFCCSYVFCYKMVNNERILVFEVSMEPY